MEYKSTIGLEIHIELKTNSKMFCSCKNDSDEISPNTNICPVCTAQPGVLPVINREAVKKTIKTALALNCEIEENSFFERKNYFYPDLPKGYQISQYKAPLSRNGWLEISAGDSNTKIKVERIHLEEDTGKLIHSENRTGSLVDFNRAGVPLMELVTEPDIHSSQSARRFIKELQMILRYLDVSDANMEKGEMRCEVNISLSKDKRLGSKVEIKNLNSIRSVEKAIDYEIDRQSKILEQSKKIEQETRGWHDKKEITFSQRKKEESHDYRYFPEPDLPALHFDKMFIDKIKAEIPELPGQKRSRFLQEYGLPEKETALYASKKDLGEYFEKVVSELREWVDSKKIDIKTAESEEFKKIVKLASNYISTDLQAMLKGGVFQEEKFPITAENFAEFLSMIYTGEISSKIAKMLLKKMFKTGIDPSQIIEESGLKQITDVSEIEKIASRVVEENKKPVEDYKKGKLAVLQFLIGRVMAESKGKANPQQAEKAIRDLLKQ